MLFIIKKEEKKNPWRQVKTDLVENQPHSQESKTNWPSILKMVTNTKHFLGIDQSDSNDGGGASASKRSPIYQNKALTNWNERTFRVLQSNAVFGGKIKEKALDRYLDSMDENLVDENSGNAFLYYKSTGGTSLDLTKRAGVADMAFKGVQKALIKVKAIYFYLLF